MGLSTPAIDAIASQVYGQFPELRGARPVVQTQAAPKIAGGLVRFLLTFKSQAHGPDGQTIQRIVRVVADERGKVLKISTSR